jgi:hypothetical protein
MDNNTNTHSSSRKDTGGVLPPAQQQQNPKKVTQKYKRALMPLSTKKKPATLKFDAHRVVL